MFQLVIAVINMERIDTKILLGTPITKQTGIGGIFSKSCVKS